MADTPLISLGKAPPPIKEVEPDEYDALAKGLKSALTGEDTKALAALLREARLLRRGSE